MFEMILEEPRIRSNSLLNSGAADGERFSAKWESRSFAPPVSIDRPAAYPQDFDLAASFGPCTIAAAIAWFKITMGLSDIRFSNS